MEKRQHVEVTLDSMLVKLEANPTNVAELEAMESVLNYYEKVGIPLKHYREKYEEMFKIVKKTSFSNTII